MSIQPHRTRALRRHKIKTPGNRLVFHYEKRKPKTPHCAVCKTPLIGIPREKPYKMQRIHKTEKRPERPYGGVLCSECMRNKIREMYSTPKKAILDVGQVCVKIAGREAGHFCVIVEKSDKNFVLIDGDVRRKRCNIMHLEPIGKTISVKKTSTPADIKKELKEIGLEVLEKKPGKVKKSGKK